MAWVASLLLFVVLAGGAIAFSLYRRSIKADDQPSAAQVSPEVLIALGRANEAAISRRAGKNQDDTPSTGKLRSIWRDDGGQTPQ